ncbi:MAG TPA: FKBP-type peptidyl-prolyl cis-trans isomerase [Alloacidobacterium sp.]|nr:FKBP-type peptidyl-prolyl cis-trans isomerase [Alloacidobacterium sp.]
MKIRASVLALLLAGPLFAQTPAAKKPVTHHHAVASPALPKNIPPVPGAPHTAYALKYIDTKVGTGDVAEPNKFYTVNYTGWLASDGTKFDSSFDHGQPITFPVGMHRVITGWDTGFAGMRVGGKRRLFIPYQLAYGENGRGPIPPKADLIFDVELLAVSDTPPATPAPPATPTQPASPPQPHN